VAFRPFVALLVLTLASTAAHAEVIESLLEDFYVVNAKPNVSVRSLINQCTRIRQDGEVYHGFASSEFSSRFHWHEGPNGACQMQRVVVYLRLKIEVPRLFDATDAQRREFDSYIVALRAHERGHSAITRATIDEYVTQLEALPSMASCDELRKRADARGREILAAGRARQAAYDRDTGHGRTQGAYLP
jgi:predicted secreted Zn-dependent protease